MVLSRRREAVIRRLHRSRSRRREGLVLVEGVRGVNDALDADMDVRFCLRSPRLAELAGGPELGRRLEGLGVDLEAISDDELAAAADTETPQGVLLVCREPAVELADLARDDVRRAGLLILDAVQDPGNVGTLIRAAAAFGLRGVVALDGTADPWSPKVVRAAAGGLFRVPVVAAPWEEVARWLEGSDTVLLAADARGDDVADLRRPERWALAVGNEGAGLRSEVLERAESDVAVPMRAGADSLNVAMAGAVLLYQLTLGGPHR